MKEADRLLSFIGHVFDDTYISGYLMNCCRSCSNPFSEDFGREPLLDDHYVYGDIMNTFLQYFSHSNAKKKASYFGKLNAEMLNKLSVTKTDRKSSKTKDFFDSKSNSRLSIALIGPPKSGKSTIFKSMIRTLSSCEECRKLLASTASDSSEGIHASFFFNDSQDHLRSARIGILSLALQLSHNIDGFQCSCLPQSDSDNTKLVEYLANCSILNLFSELIIEPVMSLERDSPVCVLMDGIEHLGLNDQQQIMKVIFDKQEVVQQKIAIIFSLKSDIHIKVYSKDTAELLESKQQLSKLRQSKISFHSLFYNENHNREFVRDYLKKLIPKSRNAYSAITESAFEQYQNDFRRATSGNLGRCRALYQQWKVNPQMESNFSASLKIRLIEFEVSNFKLQEIFCPFLETAITRDEYRNYLLPLLLLRGGQVVEMSFIMKFFTLENANHDYQRMLMMLLSLLNPILLPNLDQFNNKLLHSFTLPAEKTLDKLIKSFNFLFKVEQETFLKWKHNIISKFARTGLQLIRQSSLDKLHYVKNNVLIYLAQADQVEEIESLITNASLLQNKHICKVLANALNKVPKIKEIPIVKLIFSALLKSNKIISLSHQHLEQILRGRLSIREQVKIDNVLKSISKGNNLSLIPLTNGLERATLPVLHRFMFDKFSAIGLIVNIFYDEKSSTLTLCYQHNVVFIAINQNSFHEYEVLSDYKLRSPAIAAFQYAGYLCVLTEEHLRLFKIKSESNRGTIILSHRQELPFEVEHSAKIGFTLLSNNIIICIGSGSSVHFLLSLRNDINKTTYTGAEEVPSMNENTGILTCFSTVRLGPHSRMFFATTLGTVYSVQFSINGQILAVSFDLCVHVKVQNEDDPIVKFTSFEGEACIFFIIASESGLVGKYKVFMENDQARARILKEIKPARNRNARNFTENSLQESQVAIGTKRVISRKGLTLLVECFEDTPIKYNLPVETSVHFIREISQEANLFVTLTESNNLIMWDLGILPKGISNYAVSVLKENYEEEGAEEDSDEDEDDDFDFFLNINQDMQATNNLVDINVEPEVQQESNADDEDSSEEEEEDDHDFFLNTNREIGMEKAITPMTSKPRDSLSISVASSAGSSKRGRRNVAQNRVRYTRVEHDVYPEFWNPEWVSFITINEPKAVAAVGYKDGRLAVYSLNSSFFDKRKETFGVVGLSAGHVQLVSSRTFESSIRSIQISESGQYLACYTAGILRVFALSREGYKVGKGNIDHLSNVLSFKRSEFQRNISFSECSNYVKLSARDENAVPSLVLHLKKRQRITPANLQSLEIEWEYKSILGKPKVQTNKVTKDGFLPFHMDGHENVIAVESTHWRVCVVAQGANLHFLRY